MNNYQWIWSYVKKNKKKVIVASLILLANSFFVVIIPILSGRLIDEVIENNQVQLLVPILLAMIGATLIRTVTRYIYQMLYEHVGQDAQFDIRQDMYKKLQELDFDFFNHNRVGDIMARMTGDMDAIRHFVSWVCYNIAECVIWFVVAIIVMMNIDWKLTLALLAVTPFIFIFTQKMSKAAHPVFLEIRESFSRLNSMVEENISGNRVVKAFSREEYEIEKFNHFNDDYRKRNLDSANVSKKYLPWLDGFAGVLAVITLLLGGLFVIQGNMSIGDLVAFNGFMWLLNMPMRMSGWLINDVQRFNASCVKIRNLLITEPQIMVEDKKKGKKIAGYVTFKDVSFAFSDDPETPILKNVSFTVRPGQTVGILGETGSGKSTLVNLIARFYDPTEGEVLIDQINAKVWPVRKLRDQISMVMQDIFLFSNTIEENISFGKPYLNMEQIQRVAAIADAHNFIVKMPEGYDTIVGERGVGLSGGQKQRISLARALAKDPSILILDDTTSAVDMETESKIQKELNQLTQDKTTFIIAHRISSVRDADFILVLDKGEVKEQGTHTELVAKKGMYYDVYRRQLGLVEQEEGGAAIGP
ncbi:ABC transporter ATP-binding protein/permease [Niallia circulans]|uniref:ABC transporter ATP-binding protein n=1 Tax=Niallia circulans TaxID=1397 RepID=UPI00203D0DEE|nr:ABC transporter ATP-binding protein [Niallia circulans]MCM2980711.1 ABC transporter ATP-binding protein/permease [Niallia circulans]